MSLNTSKKKFFSSQFALKFSNVLPLLQEINRRPPKKPDTQHDAHKTNPNIHILCHLIFDKLSTALLLYFITKIINFFYSFS
jgi:hypothetical protein